MSSSELKESLEVVLNFAKDEKHTVLIVDDEENNLQLLKRTFRGKYNILTATNGVEALDVVNKHGSEISLIVSDQKMPIMEGTDFLKRVKETNPQIVKILLIFLITSLNGDVTFQEVDFSINFTLDSFNVSSIFL